MWQKFTLYDLRVITHYLGMVTLFLAAALCVPLVVALLYGEWEAAARYLFAAGVSLAVSSVLRMVLISPARALTHTQALSVTALAWLLLSLLGAIPLYMSGHFNSYLDTVFESMSAWTTTGMSLVNDLDHLSASDNMWRIAMQCIGGQGVVVIGLSLGLFGRSGSTNLYSTEGRSEHVIPNIMQTARFIVKFSAFIIAVGTVLFFLLCLYKGMSPGSALINGLWLSAASFNTGGMTAMDSGLSYYHSTLIETLVMVLALLGAINFTLHNEVWKGRLEHFFRDVEVRTAFFWVSAATVTLAITVCASGSYDGLLTLLHNVLFTVIMAFTTAGFQPVGAGQFSTVLPSGALILLMFVMAFGGSAGSTSGGIKIMRVSILGRELIAYLKDILAPASARQKTSYYHVGRRILNNDVVRTNLAVFLLFCAALLVTTVVTVSYGYNAASAMFEAVSVVSNTGMTAGIVSPGMPDLLKVLYILDMWAGRLEWVTLIALVISLVASVTPNWKGRRRAD